MADPKCEAVSSGGEAAFFRQAVSSRAKLLQRDAAPRIAANIAKLPELLRKPS